MKELRNKDDFKWYLAELDLMGKYHHRHNNEPAKYPCKVKSEFWDDPYGPYTYTHYFIYQETKICEKCGHKTEVWTDIEELE